jgi:GYF domain 2
MARWSSNYLPADRPEVCSRLSMSGVYEVGCDGCGQRHVTSAEQARKQRVVRCACGQFVRLDRALVELRSEPAPAHPVALPNADEGEEATHMLSSLAAVAALGGASRGSHGRASLASIHEDERGSRPVPRGTLRSLSPAPAKYPSTPPATDKPLWYVDLGGSETVEMTIEQLIIARRSGKLGEGALVWREGMPRWRPVGTLIPATSVAAPGPTPVASAPSRPPLPAPSRPPASLPSRPAPPPAPMRPPAPSRPADAVPESLASYERPFATLEFALEKPDDAPPAAATRSPLPSAARGPSRPAPRSVTPPPRPATWLPVPASSAPNTASTLRASVPPPPPPPVFAALPPPSPLPPRSPLSTAAATPIPTPLPSFTSDRPVEMPIGSTAWDWLGGRPRWVSACIALVVCIIASGSGAFLVRSLKMHRQPLALTPTTASGANQPLPGTSAPNHVAPLAPSAAASVPLVVDVQSLSVEHSVPRRAVRPVAAPVAKPADTTEATEPSVENTDPIDDDPKPAPQNKAKNTDLPSAAHANPYTTGSDDSSATK